MISLGGNAISPKNESGTIDEQFLHTRESLRAVMGFVKRRYNICISHGNGPQVGAELQRNELTQDIIPPLPLGMLVANTQGAIGYMIQQSLQNALYKENTNREVVTIISQVKVDKDDPELKDPKKYIGKSYNKKTAMELSEKYNWTVKEQEPDVWRRVVPSPKPLYIFNGKSIKHLVNYGTIVIAGGGGGIPSYNDKDGILHGIDGVIDKDYSAALLGRIIRADELFMITDVDNVFLNYKQEYEQKLDRCNVSEVTQYLEEGHFGVGSMEPKIKSAIYFLEYYGKKVVLTSLNKLEDALKGNSGTIITKD
jgi:carbamate kinase